MRTNKLTTAEKGATVECECGREHRISEGEDGSPRLETIYHEPEPTPAGQGAAAPAELEPEPEPEPATSGEEEGAATEEPTGEGSRVFTLHFRRAS